MLPGSPGKRGQSAQAINVDGNVVGDIDLPAGTAGRTINIRGSMVGDIAFGPGSRGNFVNVSGSLVGDIRFGPECGDNLIEVRGSMVGDIAEGANNRGNVTKVRGSLTAGTQTIRHGWQQTWQGNLENLGGSTMRVVIDDIVSAASAVANAVANATGSAASAEANSQATAQGTASANAQASADARASQDRRKPAAKNRRQTQQPEGTEPVQPPREPPDKAWQRPAQNSPPAGEKPKPSRMTAREIEEAQQRELAAMYQPPADAGTIRPGDTVVVIEDRADLYADQNLVAKLARGDELKVIEVRGNWLGVAVNVQGETKAGWIDNSKVRKQTPAGASSGPSQGRFGEQDQRHADLENHPMVTKPWKVSRN